MKPGKVLLGVTVGAVAGAIVGMLFAPAKGSATRKRLARRGTEYAEDAKEKIIDAVTEEYDIVKEGAMDLVEKGKEKLASVTEAKHAK